jgi:hypothetical protein
MRGTVARKLRRAAAEAGRQVLQPRAKIRRRLDGSVVQEPFRHTGVMRTYKDLKWGWVRGLLK